MKNIMTVDVEEHYQGLLYDNRASWEELKKTSLLNHDIDIILELFSKYSVKATFFILGLCARMYPEIVKKIHEEGHEIACHGYSHRHVSSLKEEEFDEEIKKTSYFINKAVKTEIKGFRAPYFTVNQSMKWFPEILKKNGIDYDSSVFPVNNPVLGGDPHMPAEPFDWGGVNEYPISTFKLLGKRYPFSGGFYLRTLPARIVEKITAAKNKKNESVIFYFHPREINPAYPRLKMSPFQKFIMYYNVGAFKKKLSRIIKSFQFTSFKELKEKNERS